MVSRGKGRSAPQVYDGSFYDLCQRFMESEKFKGFAEGTQALWRRELAFACSPNCLGHLSLVEIRPALVQGYLDGWSDKPGKQQNALRALQAVEKWALVRDLLPNPITRGVETGRPEGGHIPWTEAQIRHAERWARSDMSRVDYARESRPARELATLSECAGQTFESFRGQDGVNVTQ